MLVQVLGSILPGVIYLALIVPPRLHKHRPTARLVISWVAATLVFEAVLALALAGVRLPEWVGPVVLTGPLVVSWWRLGILLRKRVRGD